MSQLLIIAVLHAGEMEEETVTMESHFVLAVDSPGLAGAREGRDGGRKEVAKG